MIVDSLPFLAGIMNPNATAASVKAQAEQMRKMYSGPHRTEREDGRDGREVHGHRSRGFRDGSGWSQKSDHVAMGNAMYEMMTTDLRPDLGKIKSPTLVIGTWIAYKQYATRDEVEHNFRTQYTDLNSRISSSKTKLATLLCWTIPKGSFRRWISS